ncbi:hypothetical protein AAF712_008530 [Marasmius tenuissimus]|uniref:Uncharacterized protein n=1 Tax=Marasmius tenuissimus TaxID=585030 RepID=A0ABR2ZTD8_9AGAR
MVIQEHKTLVPWGEIHLQSNGYRFPELLKYPLAVLIALGASLIGIELELLNTTVHALLFFIDRLLVPLVATAKILSRGWRGAVTSLGRARWIVVGLLIDIPSVKAVMSWFDAILDNFRGTSQGESADDDIPEPPYACPYCRFSVRGPPAPCFALKAVIDDVGKLKGLSGSTRQAVDRDWSQFWPEEAVEIAEVQASASLQETPEGLRQ